MENFTSWVWTRSIQSYNKEKLHSLGVITSVSIQNFNIRNHRFGKLHTFDVKGLGFDSNLQQRKSQVWEISHLDVKFYISVNDSRMRSLHFRRLDLTLSLYRCEFFHMWEQLYIEQCIFVDLIWCFHTGDFRFFFLQLWMVLEWEI